MSLTSLIYRNTYPNELKTSGKKEVIFSFDAILSENHSSPATITEREVEAIKGQKENTVSDHLVLGAETFTLTAMMSETPITLESKLIGGALGIAAGKVTNFGGNLAAGVLGGLATGSLSKTGTRSSNAYEVLQGMQKSRIVLDVVTGLKNYINVMVENVSVEKNADIGKDAQFTAVFKKVRIVNSEVVSIDPALLKEDIASKASEKKNEGKNAASQASSKTTGNGSKLHTLLGLPPNA